MGVIVDLQPGDGILVEISDLDDGKDGRELLVLEVAEWRARSSRHGC